MTVRNEAVFKRASEVLRSLYGDGAAFRDGQYEAIEATLTEKRTLIVQKTGWGKSLVYFTCTKLMREAGQGVTLVVSPLLVLMQNQVEAAEKMGIRCDVLNSTVKDRFSDILASLKRDETDLILITPETLFGDEVQRALKDVRIGLFVIDEAHCISDWGHDFRLNYGNLRSVIARLPANVPVLATTATANDRVIEDLEKQLGGKVYVSRGPLTRESLAIQVIRMPDKIDRYAWILKTVPLLPGSGIIYCLTKRDCRYLSDFLNDNGISARPYYSEGTEEGEQQNREAEKLFQNNEIKVIVATVKLGMGYDKGDISFVIHFQTPQNIVSYYQQIGRAGRNIPLAYVFLLCGKEDRDIIDYFIDTAFPTEDETDRLMDLIENNDGITLSRIREKMNIRNDRLAKALAFLENDGFIRKDDRRLYYATPKQYRYDREKYDKITAIRRAEAEQMKAVTETDRCYSQTVVWALDDKTATPCGKCANCLGRELYPSVVEEEYREIAIEYLNRIEIRIEPRKRWACKVAESTVIPFVNQVGLCLSRYGDAGYGEAVKQDKYSKAKRFRDELVAKSAEILLPLVKEKEIDCVTCVPSLRSDLVRDFAIRLAEALGLPFADLLQKTGARQQKEMENSEHQFRNAFESFSAVPSAKTPEKALLVDDIVDSRWTMTVCGFRLMEAGCAEVYPFALADSSLSED
ncbi:MAG: RecQ family ATP-dependent DNA helicase [Clostridia bacterium]|nr:RecQ family ATP-dependent DNA helicase [Clostridia bacterium]